MPVDADSLGSYLRRERELRHVSLQDISAATKVQLKFLQGLEEDRYDQLPPAPFVVGFLRAYAQCLGLEPDEIIAAYYAHHSPQEGPEGHRLFVAEQEKRSRNVGWVGFGIAAVVTLLLVGFTWRLLTLDQKVRPVQVTPSRSVERVSVPVQTESASVRPASETEPAPLVVPDAGTPPASTVPLAPGEPEPPAGVAAAPAPLTASPAEAVLAESPAVAAMPSVEVPEELRPPPLVLQALALEDTWLRVDIDGDERHALLLTAGKNIQWEATEQFVLLVGNVQGTRLTLNGREVPLPPTRSNVVRDFVLTRDLVDG